jgi:hypothetical protein
MITADPFNRFENKGQPKQIAKTTIVEAYGLRKCPKLVEQISGDNLEVRNNALNVLCDEFLNPYSIEGTVRANTVPVIATMVNDADFTTRVRATHALALAAADAIGVKAILESDSISKILIGVMDPSEEVRRNVYNCMANVTRLNTGVESSVRTGAVQVFVKVLAEEHDVLKPIILKTIYRMVRCEEGLLAAINSDAVAVLIKLLAKSMANSAVEGPASSYSEHEDRIIIGTAQALGFLCFDGRAKEAALENRAIEELVGILKMKSIESDVKAAIQIAIMAITITDQGKIQMFTNKGADVIMPMLYDDSNVVILNALKIISSIAVYPKNRDILVNDSTCTAKLKKLTKWEDAAIARHAGIALNAVTWSP